MRKFSFHFLIFLTFHFSSISQNISDLPIDNSSYERTTIKFYVIGNQNKDIYNQISEYIKTQKENRKFDFFIADNPFINITLSENYKNIPTQIENELFRQKKANDFIKDWYYDTTSRQYSMERIKEKALLSATDNEKIIAFNQKRGINIIQDQGENLINRSYIIVLDFNNIGYKDIYTTRSILNSYVFKINWDGENIARFYTQGWNNLSYLDSIQIPIKYITQTFSQTTKTGDFNIEFTKLVDKALKEAAVDYPDFRIKASIFSESPLKVKLGKVDGLKIDQRFYAYKRVLTRKNKIKFRRVGILRASNSINDSISKLYIESGKSAKLGMLVEQRNDYGFGFSGGFGVRALPGPIFKLDYNLSKITKISRLKICAEIQFGTQNIYLGNGTLPIDVNSTNSHLSIAKEFNITKNIHFEPFVGFMFEKVSAVLNLEEIKKLQRNNPDLKYNIENLALYSGAKFPINIIGNLQLVPQLSYSSIKYNNSSIFGSSVPTNLTTEFKRDVAGIDDSQSDWQINKSGKTIYQNPLKFDISLRLKF